MNLAERSGTQADGYLAKLRAGAARIALDGQAAGAVTEDEAKAAAALLAKRKAQAARRKQSAAPQAPGPSPPPPELSIEGLRAAARQRASGELNAA